MAVDVPKSLNKKQKEALLAFAEACGEGGGGKKKKKGK
jgi:hypothetical protein